MNMKLIIGLVLAAAGAQGATLYEGDGELSGRLETERWLINRARYNPEFEADRYFMTNSTPGGHPDYDVCEDTNAPNDFGTTTSQWAVWKSPKAPLAPNAKLNTAAATHCKDMAETGIFTHYSPSTNYYPLSSNPGQRASREGYTNIISGFYENIASGSRGSTGGYPSYGRTPESVHEGLWVDGSATNRGHRQAILNSNAREIGLGTFQTNFITTNISIYYWTKDYDTQDFGRDSTNHFFTGTIFYDADTNKFYGDGEGVGGIEVRLWNGTSEAGWYDVSQPSGNFAIPINDLPAGADIGVQLVNTSAAPVTVTIPLTFNTLGNARLTNSEALLYGYYPQPSSTLNVGFRDVTPAFCAQISVEGTNVQIAANALDRIEYELEYSDSLAGGWTNVGAQIAATSSVEFTTSTTSTARFYRVRLLTPE